MPGSYEELLPKDQRENFAKTSSDTTLDEEIKLFRYYIGRAIAEDKQQGAESACKVLILLARAQAALGGSGQLARMLDQVGEETLQRLERESLDGVKT